MKEWLDRNFKIAIHQDYLDTFHYTWEINKDLLVKWDDDSKRYTLHIHSFSKEVTTSYEVNKILDTLGFKTYE